MTLPPSVEGDKEEAMYVLTLVFIVLLVSVVVPFIMMLPMPISIIVGVLLFALGQRIYDGS